MSQVSRQEWKSVWVEVWGWWRGKQGLAHPVTSETGGCQVLIFRVSVGWVG